jgi:hypothetical protein
MPWEARGREGLEASRTHSEDTGRRCAAGAIHDGPPRVSGAAVVSYCTGRVVLCPCLHRQRDWPRWTLLGRVGHRWTGAGACSPSGKRGRPSRLMRGVLCGVTHAAHGAQVSRSWTLGVFRRFPAYAVEHQWIPANTLFHREAPAHVGAKRGGVPLPRVVSVHVPPARPSTCPPYRTTNPAPDSHARDGSRFERDRQRGMARHDRRHDSGATWRGSRRDSGATWRDNWRRLR